MIRLWYTVLLIAVLPLVPWWCLGILCLAGVVFFRFYLEALALLFFYDLAFGLTAGGWLGTPFAFTVAASVLFLIIEGYKDQLRFFDTLNT